MKIQSQTPVLVVGFHHGGLGIARSLGRLGVPVHAVDANPEAPGLASKYCRSYSQWNFRTSRREDSVDFLMRLGERLGRSTVLIPTADDIALLVAENAERLSQRFRFQQQAPSVVNALSDKRELYHLSTQLAIPTAETVFPETRGDVLTFLETAEFPVMLKAIDGLKLQARTGKKMVIVNSAEELLEWFDRLDDPSQPNLMLQEYIPGGDDTIWMFNGYFDEHSECVIGFTGKKLRQHPIHTGSTSLGICIHNQVVVDLTARMMKAIGYRGILDIGYRYDARDGQYKLLDPNPRIGSTFRLFVGDNDMDVARALYLDLTDQPLPRSTLREGRKWVVEDQDLESSLDYAREGSLSIGEWLRSFRGVQEGAWFAWDDLRPALKVGSKLAMRAIRRSSRSLSPKRAVGIPLPGEPTREPTH